MTTVATLPCPHCGAGNPDGSTFCGSCGKALPVATDGPRIVSADGLASTGVGQTLQSDELRKQANKAFGALLAVGIIQMIFGLIITALLPNNASPSEVMMLRVMVFGIGAVFFGLAFWARYQPFPAAIVGLVLYLTLWLLDIIADPTMIYKGILIKIIIIAVLAQAIKAGSQYRKLRQQAGAV